ncbi:MAG: type II toxin-antitoxin system antitoxin SocA domain-containing protein [Pseudomonadota bacterium]
MTVLAHLHKVLQFALLAAGEQDDYQDRSLGPIHLIKYVYLADLAYASRHDGNTYTGVRWQFYNFGPMSSEVYQAIEPALLAIDADIRTFHSDYGNEDCKRYTASDDYCLSEVENYLPVTVTGTIRRLLRRYGNDTGALLEHVYRTKPMICSRPNEYLDFICAVDREVESDEYVPFMEALSQRKINKLKQNTREIVERRRETPPRRRRRNSINPADLNLSEDDYAEGLRWLDELAGDSIEAGRYEANFDDSVWQPSIRDAH